MEQIYMKFKIRTVFILLVLITACNQRVNTEQEDSMAKIFDINNLPPQPGQDRWKFIEDLGSELWIKHPWEARGVGADQTDLSKGVIIRKNFPDPDERLETAYEDLRVFLNAGNISVGTGDFVIETKLISDLKGESFRMEIEPGSCRILAGDSEGIRRGIFSLEDEMLRIRGPYLPLGKIEKQAAVIRRISRCVYGPIKRPPAMRDELMDSINYYPDQYLNRLAHEGVNGLWLSIDFRDLVSTKYNPDAAKDSKKRLDKLRKTVAQNLRYGIRTYLFTIEPRAWGNQPPYYMDMHVLDKYPELGGVRRGSTVYFCPMSNTAKDYLYQVVNTIFKEVPGLGGMINISHGERATTCASSLAAAGGGINDCPRCSNKKQWEILYASLSAMEKGMHDAAPDAELISWHYMGTTREYPDWVYEIPSHTPKGVILQFQFETGVTKTEFGKNLVGGDYWLSTPGPSERFEQQTKIARAHGTMVSAKIQTGNSHEVASIPYVPAPSLIYKKFSAMHRLDVTHTMLGWYFGNYPGLMIKSAGELAFNPFPEDETSFLHRLASVYWKNEDVPLVVDALKKFAEGYGNYPLQAMLGYYGPMHDGPVWPLLLKPVDAPLSPTWQIGSSATRKPWPPSGDRIGECLWGGGDRINSSMDNVLTLKETVELCRRMSTKWNEGTDILNKLKSKYLNEPDRILEIGLANALACQFQSGYNILNFYLLREEMFRMEGRKRLEILKQLENIMLDELKIDEQLLVLSEKDSRLGFHSEAEGYKYYPEKIQWRMQQIKNALTNDVPELKKLIRGGKLLFPEFTGKEPEGEIAYAQESPRLLWNTTDLKIPDGLKWESFMHGKKDPLINWSATYDEEAFYIIISDSVGQSKEMHNISGVTVKVEPRRLWPAAKFSFDTANENILDENVRIVRIPDKYNIIVRIPFKTIWWRDEERHPLRIDVKVNKPGAGISSWRPDTPLVSRLVFGTDNPADLGWLIFQE